ncbi:MAG: dipicolinate synthase subunit B [Lachnospiraceae bacterium]|nr:dipicolinate synthase subunit B [Lachnospiraceae bacterium]MEE1256053.1 dipicolinate synthase subunit B [Lachnospiraceae bacterium]
MKLVGLKIGVAFTGSFCTFAEAIETLKILKKEGAELYPILSFQTQRIDSRFGTAEDFRKRIEEVCGRRAMDSIETAEPIGPKALLDLLIILPCTGNTIAKLACAITDSPVLMAAKAHLRNEKPLLLAISTNDALSMNLKNIGLLMNVKNIYFVPFGQDAPYKKHNSMIAHLDRLLPAAEAALDGKQLQPVICG